MLIMTGGAIYTCTVFTVAAHTETHFHGRYFLHDRHLWNLAVAVLTTHSRLHVALMIEVSVFREVMNVHPGDWLLVFIILGELFDLGFVRQH